MSRNLKTPKIKNVIFRGYQGFSGYSGVDVFTSGKVSSHGAMPAGMRTGWYGDSRYLMQIRFCTPLGRTKTAVRTVETTR